MPKPSSGPKLDPMAGVVDRLLAQLPGLQGLPDSSRSTSARVIPSYPLHTVVGSTRDPSPTPGEFIGVWVRVLLGLSLGVMMAGWPYLRTCGFPLFGYLCAITTVIVAGGWAAVAAWRYRIALAHVVSLIVVFYGIVLVTAELLPRTGYATDHATWQCDEVREVGTVSA